MATKYEKIDSACMKRSKEFLRICGDPNTVPIQVYDPFTSEKLADIELIRELSSTLQAKKEEEDRKAEAAAAEEAREREEQKKAANEVPKEEPEETKEEKNE